MLKNEWKRLLVNRRTALLVFILVLMQFFLLFKIEIGKEKYTPSQMNRAWNDALAQLEDKSFGEVIDEWELRRLRAEVLDMVEMDFSSENLSFVNMYYKQNLGRLLSDYIGGNYRLYTKKPFDETFLDEEVADKLRLKESQSNYRATLMENAEKMKRVTIFFEKDRYSQKDYNLTYSTYEKTPQYPISNDLFRAETLLFSGSVTYLLCLFVALFLCIGLFLTEKEEGTLRITRTCYRGRKSLGVCKILVLAIAEFCAMLLLFGTRLTVLAIHYGLDDWNAYVQSIPGCEGCIYPLRIWQYYLLIFLFRYLGIMACAFIFAYICIRCKKSFGAISICVLFFATQVLLYTVFSQTSVFSAVHFLNLWSVLRFDPITFYTNLRLFGTPIPAFPVFIIFLCAIIAIFLFLSAGCYGNGRIKEGGAGKKRGLILPVPNTVSLVLWETGRLLWSKKVLPVLVLLLIFRGMILQPQYYFDMNDASYLQYMSYLKGPLTEEKVKFMEEEKNRFSELHEQEISLKSQGELAKEEGFWRACERMEYLKNVPNGEFFGDKSYRVLLGENPEESAFNQKILLVTLCLLLFFETLIFAEDAQYGLFSLLYTTKKGKKSITIRLLSGCFLAIAVWAVMYIPYICEILKKLGTEGINKPICSIVGYERLGKIPVGIYLAAVYLGKLLALLLMAGVIHFLSLRLKSVSLTLACGGVIFVLPLLIYRMDYRASILYKPFLLFLSEKLSEYSVVVQAGYIFVSFVLLFWVYKCIFKKLRRTA